MVGQALDVHLLSPVKPLATMKARLLQAPGILGEMGLLPGHTPLISELKAGILKIESYDDQSALYYFVSGGYLELVDNRATVLVENAEAPTEVDLTRALAAEKRALDRLAQTSSADINMGRAMAALERAKARQKLARLARRSSSKRPGSRA